MSMSSIPVLNLVCQRCGKEFPVSPDHFMRLGFKHLPKRCPKCVDLAQRRPSVVVERRLLNVYDGIELVSLPPGEWQDVKAWEKDVPAFKLVIKGSRYGASWSGRIDLFAPAPPQAGDVVSVREMEAKHLIKVRREQRGTLEHGKVTVEKELPITADDPEAEDVIRVRRYLTIEPFDGEPTSKLVWAEAHTKTTLKGLGRQYRARVEGIPVAKWVISGGYRSGRAHTVGVLAVVNQDHPLYIVKTGDIEGVDLYQ